MTLVQQFRGVKQSCNIILLTVGNNPCAFRGDVNERQLHVHLLEWPLSFEHFEVTCLASYSTEQFGHWLHKCNQRTACESCLYRNKFLNLYVPILTRLDHKFPSGCCTRQTVEFRKIYTLTQTENVVARI
jgi:hypothetical protein